MVQENSFTATSIESAQSQKSAILSEKFAIIFCSLLVAAFAIPLLVVIQVLAALSCGTTTVFHSDWLADLV